MENGEWLKHREAENSEWIRHRAQNGPSNSSQTRRQHRNLFAENNAHSLALLSERMEC